MLRIYSAAVALLAALGTAPMAAAAPAASAQPMGYDSCKPGWFCIYSGWNGGGTKCQWSDPSVRDTADLCSFIQKGQNVRSVWNGTGHRVQYYTGNNYHNRIGSTLAHAGGNLQGNYQIRSFRPQ
ncbi:peptidase inhibitor family I36 protein [Kutzneria kofuensis]|uniref:Peptidase inhibitor family I36 n=1 Tax=Kutzneria kofuensis TaxID=103725 RepID=A0A7W9KN88_9PSEU|nr:peptidase inhibitor family I36 protein [Kutzneria kofuensis]MBB5895678.1 hypothetical protein [Kutzneria kofuensis]